MLYECMNVAIGLTPTTVLFDGYWKSPFTMESGTVRPFLALAFKPNAANGARRVDRTPTASAFLKANLKRITTYPISQINMLLILE